MKKLIAALLLAALTLSLTACGEVRKVQGLIDAIGTVTADSGDAIFAAKDAYDALSDEDRAKVENATVLEEALQAKAYLDGDTAAARGDYAAALESFLTAGQYQDAPQRAEEAQRGVYYTEADALFTQGNYTTAAETFENARGFSDTEERILECGKALLKAEDYESAAGVFARSQAENAEKYESYASACEMMGKGEYSKAQELFTAAGTVENAPEMYNTCVFLEAEDDVLIKGHLNSAKALYEQLPADFSYNGKTAAGRLAQLEKFKSFVELCGVWKAANMDASVRQTHVSTGLWDQWDGNGWNYTMELTCTLNDDDDTANITAKANCWTYTNFSSLSKYLKYSDTSCTFHYTGTRVPGKMDYSLSFNYEYTGHLTIKSGKKFALDYQILDRNSSLNFNYLYKSFGTYDTLVNAL